jgi:hypothetical protein
MTQNLLLGVYESSDAARAAAEAAKRAGATDDEIRIDNPLDRVAAVKAEMRDEFDRAVGGPGVGPATKEMTKGSVFGAIVGATIGALVALPAAAFDLGFALWAKLLLVAICGAAVGATVGWVVGGGFGATRPETALDAEKGITVTAPAIDAVERALIAPGLVRLTLVEPDGTPLEVVAHAPEPSMARQLGQHAAEEERRG